VCQGEAVRGRSRTWPTRLFPYRWVWCSPTRRRARRRRGVRGRSRRGTRGLSPPGAFGWGRRPRIARTAQAAAGQAGSGYRAESRRNPAARAAARWSPAQTRRSQHPPCVLRRPTTARWRWRSPGLRGPVSVSRRACGWQRGESTSSRRGLGRAIAASSRSPRRPSLKPVPATGGPCRWPHCLRGVTGALSSPSDQPRRGGNDADRDILPHARGDCNRLLHETIARHPCNELLHTRSAFAFALLDCTVQTVVAAPAPRARVAFPPQPREKHAGQ